MQRLLYPLALLFFLTSSTLAFGQEPITVKKIISGTTILTSTGEKIILLGITQPKAQAIDAEDMRNHLDELLTGQEVTVVADTTIPAVAKGPR